MASRTSLETPTPRSSGETGLAPRSPMMCLAAALFVSCAASSVIAADEEKDTPARRIALAVSAEARLNSEREPEARVDGDKLAESLACAAARAAAAEIQRGTAPDESARSLLIALGITLDPSGFLRRNPFVRLRAGAIETEEEAAARRKQAPGVSLHGRRDFLQHFVVAAALAALAGEGGAWTASLQKEVQDAMTKDERGGSGSGFSFADLAADLGGIRFASRLIALGQMPGENSQDLRNELERLGKAFPAAEFVPDLSAIARDADEGIGWKDFEARFGSAADPRFAAKLKNLGLSTPNVR